MYTKGSGIMTKLKDLESILILMEPNISVIGTMINRKDLASKFGWTERSTRGIIATDARTEKENYHFLTVVVTRANFLTIKFTVKVLTSGWTIANTMGSGRTTTCMGGGEPLGPMDESIKDSMWEIKKKGKGPSRGLTGENIRVALKTDCSKGLDNTFCNQEKERLVNGIMENAFDGLNPHCRHDTIMHFKALF